MEMRRGRKQRSRRKSARERDADTLGSLDRQLDKIAELIEDARQNIHAMRMRKLPADDPRAVVSHRLAVARLKRRMECELS
jgi:prophage DNA circulation protein